MRSSIASRRLGERSKTVLLAASAGLAYCTWRVADHERRA